MHLSLMQFHDFFDNGQPNTVALGGVGFVRLIKLLENAVPFFRRDGAAGIRDSHPDAFRACLVCHPDQSILRRKFNRVVQQIDLFTNALAQYIDYAHKEMLNKVKGSASSVVEAATHVLSEANKPLSLSEILQQIKKQHLYRFYSDSPLLTLSQEMNRYCKGIKSPQHAPDDLFERLSDRDGKVRYVLNLENNISTEE